MRRLVVLLSLALALVPAIGASASAPRQLPVGSAAVPEPPEVSAESWILYDETFDVILGSAAADLSRPMASTTKMMTALLAIENGDLGAEVRVSRRAADVGESEIGLEAGEILTVRQLVTALMIRSANDAAIAVAEHIGGTVEGFVEMMNARAAELGMEQTSFANPHGLDNPDHYSSAEDLLTLARAGMAEPFFAELARTRRAVLPPNSEGVTRVVRATNRLLGDFEGAIGIKTGYTDAAGLSLVSAAERGGRRLFAVVLGSENHFADTQALLDYGFDDFRFYAAITAGEAYGVRRGPEGDTASVPAVAADDVEVVGEASAEMTVLPELRDGLPVLVARLGDEEVGSTAVAAPSLPPLPDLRDAFRWFIDTWTAPW